MNGNTMCREIFREAAAIHFRFKIESFSQLSKNSSVVKYESNEFETGGYKWKLSLYPNGNTNENGNDHISLYLVLVDSSSDSTSLPDGLELNVFFNLFLFDHIRDRYFIKDTERKTKRFYDMKKVWGFPQFVSLAKFKNPVNGYLVDDTCVFGAEVFIAKPTGNIDCLTMVKPTATTVNYTWKIENFSNLKEESLHSDEFNAGGHKWNVEIYPKGNSVGKDNNCVSLFLNLADCQENPALKVFAYYKFCVRDQINGKHIENSADGLSWFYTSSDTWGWHKFIALDVLNGQGNGYLVNDTCIVEAEVKVLGVVISKRP